MSDTQNTAELSAPVQNARGDPKSSAYCSAKALAILQAAVRMPSGIERAALERGAAGWSMRAEQLYRSETRFAQVQLGGCDELSDATQNEVQDGGRGSL